MLKDEIRTALEDRGIASLNNDDCALFVGVNDYRTYEKSTGQEPGTRSLPGSVNDAKAFWRVARWLGMRPENLRILTSPKLDPSDLGPGATEANVGEATEEGIEKGVTWLASMLAGRPERAGLASYSGHGAYSDEKGLLLCPSDTEGEDLKHAIAVSKLAALLGPAGQQVTTVLDCCYSGSASKAPAGEDEPRVMSLGRGVVPNSVTEEALRVSGRVLAASGPQELTQQSRFMGQWHGAFSWALTSAMGQWKSVPDGAGRRLDGSYGALCAQAATLLGALSFTSTPVVKGPSNVRDLAVLQRGDTPVETAEAPDGKRCQVQLDPGGGMYRWYTLRDASGHLVANVLVTGASGGTLNHITYSANTEYWYNVNAAFYDNLSASITFTWTDYATWSSGPNVGTFSFQTPRNPSTSIAAAPSTSTRMFVSNTLNVTLYWSVFWTGSSWQGSLYWYTLTTTGAANNNVFGSGTPSGQVLTASTTPWNWQYIVSAPNNTAPR